MAAHEPLPTPQPTSPSPPPWLIPTAVGVLAVAVCALLLIGPSSDNSGTVHKLPPPPPLPPVANTPFANTTSTDWVGAAACAECHSEIAGHYAQSSHATALADVSIQTEPPDAKFQHAASGRLYQVYRHDGQLRHSESIDLPGGNTHVLADHPVSMVVGTGHQGRTYLVNLDGFLVQSPITWYADDSRWRLAPGYDYSQHPSFERPVPVDCLICHAGRAESVAGAYHRVTFHEQTIGCERCHGAGSQHVTIRTEQARSSTQSIKRPVDKSIVHPGSLSRERLESVCAQCHLQNNTAANLRNRRLADFRPGQRLAEYRAHYVLDDPDSGMTVVGHVEQLHQSRCYSQASTLTCTTCHDPHRHLPRSEAANHYRAKCLECHQADSCRLPANSQPRRDAGDQCAQCHMPTTTTEIPHVASTHHRIGIHTKDNHQPAVRPISPGSLDPLYDLSHLPPLDQDRCLGLAYRQMASKQTDPQMASTFRLRSRQLLQKTLDAGLDDPELIAALADLNQASNLNAAAELAQRALEHDEQLTAQDRVNSLAVLANSLIVSRKFREAIPVLERLVTLHRNSGAWLQLSQCRMSTDDIPQAIVAAQQAVRIAPQRAEIHNFLAQLYQQSGQSQKSSHHRQIAQALAR